MTSNCDKDAEKLCHSCIAKGNDHSGKTVWHFLLKLLGIYPREMTIYAPEEICIQIHAQAALFVIAPLLQWVNGRIIKQTVVHPLPVEYYSAIKKNQLLIHTWMDLQKLCCEKSRSHACKYCMTPFVNIHEIKLYRWTTD